MKTAFTLPLRLLAALALLACVGAAPALARAENACTDVLARKKITIVVPFKPGGGNDAYARLLAPVLQDQTGARVAVSNLPGANGMLGVRAVAAAGAGSITLGVFDLRDLLGARLSDPTAPSPSAFVALGTFGGSHGLWAARQPTARLLEGRQPLTFGASTGMVPRVLLPAMLLGREVRLVRGYGGLAERWLAVLRGEVDATDGSDDSIARFVASAPGTAPLLALTSGPLPDFPGTPYLAGPGGLVDQRTKGLDAATRRNHMELAELAAELSTSARTVAVSAGAPEPVRRCLESAVEQALFSGALAEAAAARKMPLQPARGLQVRARLAQIAQMMEQNQALLKRLAAGT